MSFDLNLKKYCFISSFDIDAPLTLPPSSHIVPARPLQLRKGPEWTNNCFFVFVFTHGQKKCGGPICVKFTQNETKNWLFSFSFLYVYTFREWKKTAQDYKNRNEKWAVFRVFLFEQGLEKIEKRTSSLFQVLQKRNELRIFWVLVFQSEKITNERTVQDP